MSATTALLERDDVAEAFIKSLEAEATNNLAQAEFHDVESAWKRLEVAGGELDLERAYDVRAREKTNDYYLRVYPFTEEVNHLSVRACIERLNVWHRLAPQEPIEIIFTSGGGSVVDGLALYDHIAWLNDSGTPITTVALGLSASMAAILLQSGGKRTMGKESWLMIHEIAFGAGGKIGDVEDVTAWVRGIQTRVLKILEGKSKMTSAAIKKKWARKDWWIDSTEALKLGLIDEIR